MGWYSELPLEERINELEKLGKRNKDNNWWRSMFDAADVNDIVRYIRRLEKANERSLGGAAEVCEDVGEPFKPL
jgi:hypothetical protein